MGACDALQHLIEICAILSSPIFCVGLKNRAIIFPVGQTCCNERNVCVCVCVGIARCYVFVERIFGGHASSDLVSTDLFYGRLQSEFFSSTFHMYCCNLARRA